ncbi:nucleolar and spindle-associated protein 1 [Pristis pectinata]|uniref:nucleolar and spindle-associated protein 1 n=1 Tax=Pristis pectinata TaxID=685728 RepID=UPI00223C8FF1|nr:nucleolar and spindle-associated protein 1 [Pristis pectinata]
MELDGLRYSELQQLAKQCGLKANLKADKLCKLLQEYFREQPKDNADVQVSEDDKCNTTILKKGEDAYVTKRWGKGRLLNKSKEEQKENQNESGHQQATSETEQPSMVVSPLSENCQNTKGSDSKRKQRKRHAEFELSADTGTERIADENAAATQCKHLPTEEATATSKGAAGQSKTLVPGGKIPVYVGAAKKTGLKTPSIAGKTGLKNATPDWKKIHEANFNKMESIDLYVERKRKRLEVFSNSIKQVKMLAESSLPRKTFETQCPGSNVKKSLNGPQKSMPSLLSPVQQTKTTQLSTPASQSKLPRTSVFKPSVHSVSKMNVRFSEATNNNEKKQSAMKTPARMSPYTEPSSNLGTEEVKINKSSQPMKPKGQRDTSIMEHAQTKVVTPYKFSGNATPGTNKKFDLQASLSRPLRYKPHKGKLKAWEETREIRVAENKSQNTKPTAQNYKQPKLQTRENRREKFVEKRKEMKNNMMGARRGLVME